MPTLSTILKEMKDVPANRLEELYEFVRLLTSKTKLSRKDAGLRKKILSFGGAFSDMSHKDYSDFLHQTKKVRTTLFDRTFD